MKVRERSTPPTRCSFCHEDLGPSFTTCFKCNSSLHPECAQEFQECPTCREGRTPTHIHETEHSSVGHVGHPVPNPVPSQNHLPRVILQRELDKATPLERALEFRKRIAQGEVLRFDPRTTYKDGDLCHDAFGHTLVFVDQDFHYVSGGIEAPRRETCHRCWGRYKEKPYCGDCFGRGEIFSWPKYDGKCSGCGFHHFSHRPCSPRPTETWKPHEKKTPKPTAKIQPATRAPSRIDPKVLDFFIVLTLVALLVFGIISVIGPTGP